MATPGLADRPDPPRTVANGLGKQPAEDSDRPAPRDDDGPTGRTLADGIGKQPAEDSGQPAPRDDGGPTGRTLADGIGKQPAEDSDQPAPRDDDGPAGRTLADGIGKQPADQVEGPSRTAAPPSVRPSDEIGRLPQVTARTVGVPESTHDTGARPTAAPPAAVPPTAAPAGASTSAAPAAGATESGRVQAPDAIGTAPTTFDVVRIDRRGDVVAAGRTAPNATVTLAFDGRAIGRTQADGQGQWVYLSDRPVATVQGELSAEAVDASGRILPAADVVMVVRAADGDASAAEQRRLPQQEASESQGQRSPLGPTTRSEQEAPEDRSARPAPLAVLVPQEGAPVVLQGPQTGITIGDFSLNSLTYDASGRITVGGHLGRGGRAFVYVDDAFIGEATPNGEGRWSLSGRDPVEYGLHRLRIDQVDPQGAVLARIETPFVRSERLPDLSQAERFVIVQPGSNLWTIARRTYGGGLQYVVIFNANTDQIKDPDLIYPGQIFALPGGD